MRQRNETATAMALACCMWLLCACSSNNPPAANGNDPAEPAFSAELFSTASSNVDNPYFPLVPGTVQIYEIVTEDETEIVVVEVLDETRTVAGVVCVVVRDRVYVDELLIEDTHDWYAQDDEGNVWYMGEEVVNYEYDDDGNLEETNDDGSWESGVDGAEPGIAMWAAPVIGAPYRQEFYEDEAEDMAVVVATDATVILGDGTIYVNCLQILEWTPLEPFAVEYKYYASGVGVVLEDKVGADERVELTDFS